MDKTLKKRIIKRGIQVFGFLFLQVAFFFGAAGRFDLPRAWFLFGIEIIYLCFNMYIFLKYCPELIAERSEIKPGIKTWDIAFAVLYSIMILVLPAVAGLDVGRFQWSNLGIEFAVLGTILYVVSGILISWSMLENKFFELTVRIQKERHQYVVSTGPYAIVRHPGYAGMILMYIAMPLVVGSLYALIGSAVILVLFIIRTALEDKTLQKGLKGYKEYAKKVKYRLVPFVW